MQGTVITTDAHTCYHEWMQDTAPKADCCYMFS